MRNFLHLRLLSAIALLLCSLASSWAETPFYTFQAKKNTSNTAYASNYDVVIGGMTWSVPGNQNNEGFVRIGGKSITNTDRAISAKTAMGATINRIVINHNGKTNASLTVNSVSLTVADDANFSQNAETTKLTPTIEVSTSGTIEFSGDWTTGKYYKITFNLTNTNKNSNYGIDVASIDFYSPDAQTLEPANLSFSSPTIICYEGDMKALGFTKDTDASVTFDSSDATIAEYSEGVLYAYKPGSVTITAHSDATEFYAEGTATLLVTVRSISDGVYILKETFDSSDGTGGNDGSWSGNIASATLLVDNAGWTGLNGSGANKCAKYGTSSLKGSATTPALIAIPYGETKNCVLTFKAAAWNTTDEKTTLDIGITAGGGILSQTSIEMLKGEWTEYTIFITGATSETRINFSAQESSKNRFFLDEILVKELETLEVTVGSTGFATFCPVSFDVAIPAGVEVYYVKKDGIGASEVTLVKYDGDKLKAGEGVILHNAGTYNFEQTTGAESIPNNELYGVTEDEALSAGDAYILANQDGQAVLSLCGAGTIKAGKACLINAYGAGAPALRMVIADDEATAINKVQQPTNGDNQPTYNLAGQKVGASFRGIVVVNGKKILQ